MKNQRHTTDWLPFGALTLDERYQRSFIPAKVKKLAATWRDDLVGVITVSIRADGKAYVIDGQHRTRAAMERGFRDTKAFCRVWRGLSLEEEAYRFLGLNDANKITATDRYKAGLVARDATCLGVQATLAKHNLAISDAKTDGYIRCVTEVFKIYERAPDLLDEVLSVLTEAWGTRLAALERIPVASMGTLLGRYNGEVDRPALVKKLSKYRGGPAALVGDARGLADYKPISITRAAAEIMRDTYNRGRRTGQLSQL